MASKAEEERAEMRSVELCEVERDKTYRVEKKRRVNTG